MTLIVEDGTGVTDAESYASVAGATAYWAKRPQDPLSAAWTSSTVPYQEGALRSATTYLDATWGPSYLGARVLATQSLLWPRMTVLADPGAKLPLYRHYGIARPYGLRYPLDQFLFTETEACDVDLSIVYGADGLALEALPSQIVVATIELGARALGAPLAPDYVTGARLKSEAAGDTKFEYFDDGRAAASFGVVAQILTPLLGAGGQAAWSWR